MSSSAGEQRADPTTGGPEAAEAAGARRRALEPGGGVRPRSRAIVLASIQLAAMLRGADAEGTGYAFGRLVLGPVLVGALIWAGLFAIRRRNPVVRFLSPGLAVTIALLAIAVAYSSAVR